MLGKLKRKKTKKRKDVQDERTQTVTLLQISIFSVYPLTPRNDYHLVSPNSNTPESKVMTIKEMVVNSKSY